MKPVGVTLMRQSFQTFCHTSASAAPRPILPPLPTRPLCSYNSVGNVLLFKYFTFDLDEENYEIYR